MHNSLNTAKKERISAVLLICLVVLCLLWKTVTGFDADEQCAIVTAHRFIMGDRYMLDMFDAYQFSALFASPFWYVSLSLFPAYPVIAFRLVSIVIYAFGSIPVYRWLARRTESSYIGLLSALVWITALPKSILSLDHSNLAMMFITYIVLLLDSWDKQHPRPVLMGVLVSALALCYPPMVITAVFVFLFMAFKGQLMEALKYTVICFVLAGIVFAPVIMNAGISGLLHGVHMILLDGSHSLPPAVKIAAMKADGNAFAHYAVRMCMYAAAAAGLVTATEVIMKKTDLKPVRYLMIAASIPFCHIIAILTLRGGSPIDYYDRYLLVLILTILAAIAHRDGRGLISCLYLVTAWIIAIAFTNNGFFAADAYVMISVLLLAAVAAASVKKKEISAFLTMVLVSQCACLFLCARLTGTMPNSVFHEEFIGSGEFPFMKLEKQSADFFAYACSSEELMESDNLVVSGYDEYAYVILDKNILAPVTISTISYGPQWEEYYAGKMPHDINVLAQNDDNKASELLKILSRWYTVMEVSDGNEKYDLYYLKKQ